MKITKIRDTVRLATTRWIIFLRSTGWFEVYQNPTFQSSLGEVYVSDPGLVGSGMLTEDLEVEWEVAPPEDIAKEVVRILTRPKVVEAWKGGGI
jgi:hypothetical protein